MSIFNKLQHFSEEEAWGEPSKINGLLLLLLDRIRDALNSRIRINGAYSASGHSEYSQHYRGNAVDFVVLDVPHSKALVEIEKILVDLQVDHVVGFGVYPDWNTPGFHLDVRGSKARWGRVQRQYVAYEPVAEKLREAAKADSEAATPTQKDKPSAPTKQRRKRTRKAANG